VERWDKSAKVHFDKRVFQELCSLRFVEDARNVVILGPVGVGKTFLAAALGHLACKSGFNVLFHRADALLRKLRQSRLDNSRDSLMAELIAIDLLVVDDFALEPMTREESRDVYQLFVERTGRAASVVTNNRDTAEWLTTFDDTLLAQSAIDASKTLPTTSSSRESPIDPDSSRPSTRPGPPRTVPSKRNPSTPAKSGNDRGLDANVTNVRSGDRSLASHPGPMILTTGGPMSLASDSLQAGWELLGGEAPEWRCSLLHVAPSLSPGVSTGRARLRVYDTNVRCQAARSGMYPGRDHPGGCRTAPL